MQVGPNIQGGVTGKAWTAEEIDVAVTGYLSMLRKQESGQPFNKSECNRMLKERLPARSMSAISQKHSNISAVLTLLGIQSLRGYWPLFNFQRALADAVATRFNTDPELVRISLDRVLESVETPKIVDYPSIVVAPPRGTQLRAGAHLPLERLSGLRRDYLSREAMNRSVGLAGEQFVLEFEKLRLVHNGLPELADQVEHVSVSKGDGLGYDILSFSNDGTRRLIEVKATSYGIHTPIFISANEMACSSASPNEYWLYRVFNLRAHPKMYTLPGEARNHFDLEPLSYRGWPRSAPPL